MSFAVVGGAVIAGGAAVYASRQASHAATGAGNRALSAEERMADQNRTDLAPYREIGTDALNDIQSLYGRAPIQTEAQRAAASPVRVGDADLPPGTTTVPLGNGRWRVFGPDSAEIGVLVPGGPNGKFQPNGATIAQPTAEATAAANPTGSGTPDMSRFFASPDYQFRFEQGQNALGNSLVARSGALSGQAVKEALRFGQGLGSEEFGNYYNRLASQAGIGQAATNTGIAAGLNSTGNVTNILQNQGNAQASAYMTAGQGVNSAVQGGLQNYLLQNYLKQPSYGAKPYAGVQGMNYSGPLYGGGLA